MWTLKSSPFNSGKRFDKANEEVRRSNPDRVIHGHLLHRLTGYLVVAELAPKVE